MALETLKDVKEIGGFEVGFVVSPKNEHDFEGYENYKRALGRNVIINHKTNTISFSLQNGPIKEVGVTGCQVDTLIEAAKLIIEGLNKNHPCIENATAILKLEAALDALNARKKNREARGVEGLSKE